MTQKPKVLILTEKRSELAVHVPEFKEFQRVLDVHIYRTTTKDDFLEKLATTYSDVDCIFTTGTSLYQFGGLVKNVQYFPKSVKLYVFTWVGYLEEEARVLRERGIKYCNVGDVSSHDVADVALLLTLDCFRFATLHQKQFRETLSILTCRDVIGGEAFDEGGMPLFPPDRDINIAHDYTVGGKQVESPTGKIAGIVGLGAIGKEIAKRLNAIGMEIRYTKRSPLTELEERELGFKTTFYKSFDELITEVDLIVNAAPHSPMTIKLINENSLKKVKRGVRIVNIGRGSFIDEDALLKALDDGTVCSVGLDVFLNEPSNVDERFAKRWDVVMTPHLGNVSKDNIVNSSIRCMENIKNVLLEGGDGINPVP